MSFLIVFGITFGIMMAALSWEWRQIPKRQKRLEHERMMAAIKQANQAFVKFGVSMKGLIDPLKKAADDIREFYKVLNSEVKK